MHFCLPVECITSGLHLSVFLLGLPPPMALCDIHVAGCGEHLPARGLRDDRMPGTDQAEDAMGRSCILD